MWTFLNDMVRTAVQKEKKTHTSENENGREYKEKVSGPDSPFAKEASR